MIIESKEMKEVFAHMYKQDNNDVRWMKCTIYELPDNAGFIAILCSYDLSLTNEQEKLKFHDVKSAFRMSEIMKEASQFIGTEY